jgi:hypothetical protein
VVRKYCAGNSKAVASTRTITITITITVTCAPADPDAAVRAHRIG